MDELVMKEKEKEKEKESHKVSWHPNLWRLWWLLTTLFDEMRCFLCFVIFVLSSKGNPNVSDIVNFMHISMGFVLASMTFNAFYFPFVWFHFLTNLTNQPSSVVSSPFLLYLASYCLWVKFNFSLIWAEKWGANPHLWNLFNLCNAVRMFCICFMLLICLAHINLVEMI